MQNIRLDICYDASNYFGWQKTSFGPSIEEKLENSLFTLLRQKVSLQAASRTDKGVHAKKLTINFLIKTDIKVDLDFLKYKLNCLLFQDIRVLDISSADISFI